MSANLFYEREQQRHLAINDVECPIALAWDVIHDVCEKYSLPIPSLIVTRCTTMSFFSPGRGRKSRRLEMRKDFTLGDLAHELAHLSRWELVGDHRHDAAFTEVMDEFGNYVLHEYFLVAMVLKHEVGAEYEDR